MVFRMCVNQPPTGGRKGPLNSQTQKLAVGAPTGISWAPRVHGGLDPVPTGSRAHGTSPCPRGSQDSLQQSTKTCITLAYELRI